MTDEHPQLEEILKGMAGLDASRRVGWAKYYDSESRFSVLSGSTAAREGFVAGVLEQAAEWQVPIKSAVRLVIDYLEGRTAEPEDVEKYQKGWDQGADLLKHYWLQSAETPEPDIEERLIGELRTHADQGRCGHCGRLLFYATDMGMSVKCPRCKKVSVHSYDTR